jgi:hypothetical protein
MKSLLVSFLVFALALPLMAKAIGDVPFQVVARGQYGGESDQGIRVFRTERAFEEFSKDKSQEIPKRLLKDIDWDREQIVVVFGGQQPTGGFSIDVKRIQSADIQRLTLEAVINKPSGLATQAIATPYLVLRMARQVASIKVKFLDN